MTASVWAERMGLDSGAERALTVAARFWFVIAVAGQWLFAAYVLAFYGGAAVQGNLEAWNKVLPRGHVAGDPMNNIAVAVHLLLAVVITIGGPLQLVPQIRKRFPAFHRWNGRVYMPAVVLTSAAGLFMTWGRGGGSGDVLQKIGISGDAVLIVLFAVLATRYAMARDIATHRRWALRLFLVVSAVWFFRVGLMFWIVVNRGPMGFDPKTFTGPTLTILSFADYLVPLLVLELYLRAKERGAAWQRFAVAALLVVLTLATAAGIFAATMGLWLPHM